MPVDERTFVADVKTWVERLLDRRPGLPFRRVSVEEHTVGGRKRLDFMLYGRSSGVDRVALTGEVKMPDSTQGRRGCLDSELVEDAFEKASRHGAPYYFTWNVREFALFQTHQPGVPFMDRRIEGPAFVTEARVSEDVRKPAVEADIQSFWEAFLDRLVALQAGASLRELPLDQRFIRRLEASLERPITSTVAELERRYRAESEFRNKLNAWMRDVQGWELSETPDALESNWERAARLSSYSLLNRMVFYEVLRRKFRALPALIGLQPATGAELSEAIDLLFSSAVRASHDYETVFALSDFGAELPFLPADSGALWRAVIKDIGEFDFSRLDYDVIGKMYEQLIGPQERRRYGQFYTVPDIVDLINAFCIRTPDAHVMDPACGGGTFLVRAYARKGALARQEGQKTDHKQLLSELFGCDIAAFPAQLSTINLAVRHLSDEPNYPQVVQRDFFEVRRDLPFARLPRGPNGAIEEVFVGELDAIVANPPYVRQEELPHAYKTRLNILAAKEWRGEAPPRLSGRSDIYAHFYAHAAALVRPGGYIGMITSVGWLDTEYGFRLQEFFLQHFRIVAIIESEVDKWFEDARVQTVVTILQREPSETARRANRARFILLRKPIGEIWSALLSAPVSAEAETMRQHDMDAVRDLIEEVVENQTTDYWRVRVFAQSDLWDMGRQVMVSDSEEENFTETPGKYNAGKWGQFLRAPDVWAELLARCRHRMVPLSNIAQIRRGFTSGIDKFYCVRDVTDQELQRIEEPLRFQEKWGVTRSETKDVRIVLDGDGGLHLIEARFLEPEFHRLTEAKRIIVRASDVGRMVINAPLPPAMLRGSYLERYIQEAQARGWTDGATVHSRSQSGPWYDLRLAPKDERADFFWSKSHQYRHLVPWNADGLPGNSNLYDCRARPGIDSRLIWAILNSTVVALSKHQFGRPAGIEGNLKTEVVDVDMMLVPDPRGADAQVRQRILDAADRMATRATARMLPDEFEAADRNTLDDAVLELLGFEDADEREQVREELYEALRSQYGVTRARELVAQRDRGRSARRGVSPSEIAAELWAEMVASLPLQEFPRDFVRRGSTAARVDLPAGRVEVGQAMLDVGQHLRVGTIRVGGAGGQVLDVGSLHKAKFLAAQSECGHYGPIELPDEETCQVAVELFEDYKRELGGRFDNMARERTRDARRQRAIAASLLKRALAWRRE